MIRRQTALRMLHSGVSVYRWVRALGADSHTVMRFLQANGAATGQASKNAFHQGIVMCRIFLGVAPLAAGIDWLREARDRAKTSAAVVTSGKEAATTAVVLTPEGPTAAGTQRSEATESVDA